MKKTLLLLFIFFFANSYSTSRTKIDSIATRFDSVNIEMKNEILKIKRKNDSLTKRLDQIEKNDYKSVDVIEKVNDFYDTSWNKLIAFLSIAGSIILIVIPYIQIKNYDEKIDLKTNEFENLINGKVLELELKISEFHKKQFELLRKEINLSQDELNKNIKNETQYVQAFVFVLRGMLSLKEEDYNTSLDQYTIALNLFIGSNKNSPIESMIKEIIQAMLKSISKEKKITTHTKSQIDKVIITLEKDYYKTFPELIDKLKNQSSKLIIN